jgi:pectin methylesterase-like acyl-CoA thioesterase
MVSLPTTGQFGSIPAAVQATTDSGGVGKFLVQTPGGVRCYGEFQVRDPSPALVVLGKCSNGKSGQIVIARTANLMSGSAIVRLSDGTRGPFVFGDLPSGQAFGARGSAQVR